MNEKPEALAVAESLELHAVIPPDFPNGFAIPCVVSRADLSRAAAELRRQHEQIKRLRGLLEKIVAADDDPNDKLTYIRSRLLAEIKAALRGEEA